MVYAIVKAGGRQEKVSVGDIVVMNSIDAKAGDTVELPALLLVDGEKVTTDAKKLAKVKVTAEVVRARRSSSSSTRTRPATASVRVTVSR